MPLCYLRRPLFWCLVLYMAALALLHQRGFFAVRVPSRQLLWRGEPDVRLEGRLDSPRREDMRGVKFVLTDAQVRGERAGVKLIAYLPRDQPGLETFLPGRRVMLTGALRLPRSPRNPGEFDERGFLSDRGIGWIMRAERSEMLPDPVPWRYWLFFCAEKVRLSMQRCFESGLGGIDAKLLTGITLGYKGPLPFDLNRAIQDAGAMHLLVPSGAKVAFVLLVISFLSSALGLPAGVRLGLTALGGGFYTLMVGADPPYARAYLGALAIGLGLIADRDSGAFQAVVLSAWSILLAEPRALFSAGFQMTYLAMAGLLLAMPSFNAALPDSWPRALRGLVCVATVTVVVQVMLWPVFAGTFGRAALVGAAANLPLVPLSGAILAAGFGFWGLSFFSTSFLPTAARPVQGLLALFRWICFHAAGLPWAAVELSPMSTTAVLAYYLSAAAVLVLPRRRAAAVLAAAALFVWAAGAAAARFETAPLRVVYLCLPHQNVAIAWVHGESWLIGADRPSAPVRKALKALGATKPDHTVFIKQEPEFSLCEGATCFFFDPPRIHRGSEEFSIIDARLKRSAVQATTDGSRIEIKSAIAGAFH